VDLALVHARRDGLEYRRRMMEVVDMTVVIRMGGILDEHDGVEQQLLGQVRSGQAMSDGLIWLVVSNHDCASIRWSDGVDAC